VKWPTTWQMNKVSSHFDIKRKEKHKSGRGKKHKHFLFHFLNHVLGLMFDLFSNQVKNLTI